MHEKNRGGADGRFVRRDSGGTDSVLPVKKVEKEEILKALFVTAGIESRIPPDKAIDVMQEIGSKMDASLRETALGGLAATKSGCEITSKIMGD